METHNGILGAGGLGDRAVRRQLGGPSLTVEYVKCGKCNAWILKAAASLIMGQHYCATCARHLL